MASLPERITIPITLGITAHRTEADHAEPDPACPFCGVWVAHCMGNHRQEPASVHATELEAARAALALSGSMPGATFVPFGADLDAELNG